LLVFVGTRIGFVHLLLELIGFGRIWPTSSS